MKKEVKADGATTQALAAQYDALEVVTDGVEWFVV